MEISTFDNWRGKVMTSESHEWYKLQFMAAYTTQIQSRIAVNQGDDNKVCEMAVGISV